MKDDTSANIAATNRATTTSTGNENNYDNAVVVVAVPSPPFAAGGDNILNNDQFAPSVSSVPFKYRQFHQLTIVLTVYQIIKG